MNFLSVKFFPTRIYLNPWSPDIDTACKGYGSFVVGQRHDWQRWVTWVCETVSAWLSLWSALSALSLPPQCDQPWGSMPYTEPLQSRVFPPQTLCFPVSCFL